MRRSLAVLLLVPALLAVAPAAEAVPTCGGKKATMVYGDGDDYVFGTAGDDVVVLGAGDDMFQESGGGRDLVCGGPGDDYVDTGEGRAEVWGGAGRDDFFDRDAEPGERPSTDLFHGGPGTDHLAFTGPAIRLTVADGHERGHENDAFTSVEAFTGTYFDDVFVGTPGPDRYSDGGGSDQIDTGAGDDTIGVALGHSIVHAGPGDDQVTVEFGYASVFAGAGDDLVQVNASRPDLVDGGAGTDLAGFWFDDEGVAVDLAAGTGSNQTVGDFPLTAIENVTGTRYDDTIYGDDGPNRLDGGLGVDTIDGRGGDDVCFGTTVVNC